MNQNKRLAALNNKDNNKETFEELVKEKFDEIKELIAKISHNDLINDFKGNTVKNDLMTSVMVQNLLKT